MDIHIQIIKKLVKDFRESVSSGFDSIISAIPRSIEVSNFPETEKVEFPEVQKVEVVNEREEVEKVEVVNQKEFPKQIKVEVMNQPEFPAFPKIEFPPFPQFPEIPKEISLSEGSPERKQYVVMVDKHGEPIDFDAILQHHFERLISALPTPIKGTVPSYGGGTTTNHHEDIKTFDGSDNTMTLSREPKLNSLHLFLGVGGGTVKQTQGAGFDYTIRGRVVTFIRSSSDLNGLVAVANYATTS